MIVALAKILGVDAWLARVLIAGAVVLAVGFGLKLAHDHVYDSGYAAASLKYEAQIAAEKLAAAVANEEERRRQVLANEAAKKREAQAIAEIERQDAQISELRKELRREAEKDPDSGKPSIGLGGVRRIDQIR